MENIVAFSKNNNRRPKVTELLRLYRTRSGLTQNELGHRLGLQSERMVSKWENGQSIPEASRLKKLVELYLVEGIFTRGQERQEAQVLWASVKLAFELQSLSFEIYHIFDAAWFDALLAKRNEPKVTGVKSLSQFAGTVKLATSLEPGFALTNLPFQLTELLGRENDLDRIKKLLEKARLLTLTGPAGVGKSRLAIEAGWQLLERFKDGVWLVRLGSSGQAGPICKTIAAELEKGAEEGQVNAIGLPETEGDLRDYLHSRSLLLVVDACDLFTDEAGLLIDLLLKSCPDLKILATSRESLAIGAETIFKVTPLDFAGPFSPGTGTTSPATSLFIERAGEIQSSFSHSLTEQDFETVGRICRKLDGLPFAIELAASLVEGFSLDQVEARLTDPIKLLRSRRVNSNNSFGSYNSLESSLAFSYDRLGLEEKQLLKFLGRLSESRPVFTLKEIEQSYLEEGKDVMPVLDLLYSLVKKSMVESQFDPEGNEIGFNLLNLIRQFVLKNNPLEA